MKTKPQNKFRFYVTDWNPNGTNSLIIRDSIGRQIDYFDDALFGIDVNKLGRR